MEVDAVDPCSTILPLSDETPVAVQAHAIQRQRPQFETSASAYRDFKQTAVYNRIMQIRLTPQELEQPERVLQEQFKKISTAILRHLNPRKRSRGGYNNNRQFSIACDELSFRRLLLAACRPHQKSEEQVRRNGRKKAIVIELQSLADVISMFASAYLHRVSKHHSIFSFVGPKALVSSPNLLDKSFQPERGAVLLVLEQLSPDSLRVLLPSSKAPAVDLPFGAKKHTLNGTIGVISRSSVVPMPAKLTFNPYSRKVQILLPYWDVASDNVTILTTTYVLY